MSGGYGLLGERLTHSFSPQIHSLLADYEYLLYEKAPEEVDGFLRRGDFDGLNVTIPYKKTVLPFCAALSDSAQKTGSVNTLIRLGDGSLYGDNTDYFGFKYLLCKTGVDVRGKKALVLGSGGSSLTVRAVLGDMDALEIIVVSRSGEDNYGNIAKHTDARVIVNTTPVGMYPNNGVSPVKLADFTACEAVLDLIYNPARTELLLDAEDMGVSCMGGLYMLAAQAKRSAEIFLKKDLPDDIIDSITEKISRGMKNIILIGMPGCGKSTAGRALAKLCGREFYDTDAMITMKAGKSITRIFEEDGEEAFRRMETEAIKEVSSGCASVIATGGGIVKIPENLRLIKQNSFAVYLERELGDLPADGRPLSLRNGIQMLAEERIPLYEKWSDFSVHVGGVQETANSIKEKLKV